MVMCMAAVAISFMAIGQTKMDEVRMEQDIEVAENVLSTLVRQQFGKRNFLPMEVEGSYLAGYGVTFRLPQSGAFNLFMMKFDSPNIVYNDGPNGSFSYSISSQSVVESEEEQEAREIAQREAVQGKQKQALRTRTPKAKVANDSLAGSIDKKFVDIAKNFLADYGDMISQLLPEEKIVITNRTEEFGGDVYFGFPGKGAGRSMMSVEATRGDITQLKQGKITRDQFLSKLKIVNSESTDKLDPDLEVFSSMFSRLYQEDLSKTYYTQGNVPYERLKDFGVIYYMKVYSSVEGDFGHFAMPTIAGMEEVSQPERDKKVKEMYPKFEAELKDNLIEYGRTLRSLKDDEQIVINVKMTRCVECNIPVSLELSVKNLVLKDYSSGKISKEAALAKVSVKKVGNQ